MFQNDWFMREIENLSSGIAKVMFHRQATRLDSYVEQYSFDRERLWVDLMAHVNNGNIDASENLLFDHIFDTNFDLLQLADDFYEYLDSLDDAFLKKSNFPRAEIARGAKDFVLEWGKNNC